MTTLQLARLFAVAVVLAGLDLAGTVALKEAALRRDPGLAILGTAFFVGLAAFLYRVLPVADLTWVSLGWIIAVQTAVVAVDVLVYGVRFNVRQLVALSVAVAALAVAMTGPTPDPRRPDGGDDRVPLQRAAGERL